MLTVLRWLLVVPMVAVGYVCALVSGLSLPGVLPHVCPAAQLTQEGCLAWWFKPMVEAVHLFSMAIGASLAVGLAAWMAPQGRAVVAWLVLLASLSFFVIFNGAGQHSDEWFAAMVGGALPALAFTVHRRRVPSVTVEAVSRD